MKIRALLFICCTTILVSAVEAKIKEDEGAPKQIVHIEKMDKRVSELMADRVNIRKNMELKELATLSEIEMEEKENLMFPADELYGSNWENRWVDPFRGAAKVNFPDSFAIDCSSFVYPIAIDSMARITSKYGPRRRRMHNGLDIKVYIGDTIRAAFSGKVRMVKYERRGYGKYVVIRHENGLETVYGHLSKQIVDENQYVEAGEPIGLGGNTGRSTGSHLHFETRFLGQAINPALLFDFEKQDIVINVDLRKEPKVRIQINPLFIEGKYNKLVRGIPQTKWPCGKCKGKGCEECNFTGKQYRESVEELLSEPILEATNGWQAKFHGAGREDIDVLMLGSGRPFVLEIKEPKIRKINLDALEEKINKMTEGKTSYHNLKFCERNRKAEIKVSSSDAYKIYKALVKCDKPYDKDKLASLNNLDEIHQQTPLRVLHRRADKVRIKHVHNVSCEIIDDTTFEMTVKTEGGLYIKELISGDEDRTKPNVGEVLGVKSICEQLDVVEVSEK